MTKGFHYHSTEEIQPKPWLIQGTVFPTLAEAKMAALKLYSSLLNDGVHVKKITNGYSCFYWRRK